MSFEFPPMPDARTYTPQHREADEIVRFLSRIPGIWARRSGGGVLWGKLGMIVSEGAFIPNTMTESDLDEVEARVIAYDATPGASLAGE